MEEEDLIVDIATTTLTEQGYDVGKWRGEQVMQVECHDEGYLARIFVAAAAPQSDRANDAGDASGVDNQSRDKPQADGNAELPVGVPLALLCDSEDGARRLQALQGTSRQVLEGLGAAVERDAIWQAYVKAGGGHGAPAPETACACD